MLEKIHKVIWLSKRIMTVTYYNNVDWTRKEYVSDDNNIWMWDVIEYLVRNDHITVEWESWYELRCHTMERRDNGEYPISEQSIECITFIHSLISND